MINSRNLIYTNILDLTLRYFIVNDFTPIFNNHY